jgi:hypothetical protein
MQLALKDNLPFVHLKISYQGEEIEIADVLVDTGSATTSMASWARIFYYEQVRS